MAIDVEWVALTSATASRGGHGSHPLGTDPELDLFARPVPLDPAFLERYRAAQVERNHRVTRWSRDELQRLFPAGAWDRVFTFARGWADPRFVDLDLDPSDRRPGCYAGDPQRANRGP